MGENIHRENILHETIVPARISEKAEEAAIEKAIQLAQSFQLVGTLAVEMFITSDDLYVNELAPRPHNSGHYSIEACETSQFEQHIRAVCNWPLANTELLKPAVMVNILGEHQDGVIEKIPKCERLESSSIWEERSKAKKKNGSCDVIACFY